MEYDINRIFGKNLRRLRNRANLSQLELSTCANLSLSFINSIESGQKWVSPATFAALTGALQAKPFEFFLTDDIPENDPVAVYTNHQTLVSEIEDIVHRYSHTKDAAQE